MIPAAYCRKDTKLIVGTVCKLQAYDDDDNHHYGDDDDEDFPCFPLCV